MYSGEWMDGSSKGNTEQVVYNKSNDIVGSAKFDSQCSDATIPIQMGSVNLSLRVD